MLLLVYFCHVRVLQQGGGEEGLPLLTCPSAEAEQG